MIEYHDLADSVYSIKESVERVPCAGPSKQASSSPLLGPLSGRLCQAPLLHTRLQIQQLPSVLLPEQLHSQWADMVISDTPPEVFPKPHF